MRHIRKIHHIALALRQQGLSDISGFSQIKLIHNCVTEISPNEVSLESEIFGRKISSPFIINAITGGPQRATNINIKLAVISKHFNIPMAVGSQTIAVKDSSYLNGFRAVRRINPEGILIANVGANVSLDTAKRAVDMIRANALQLHLNPAQELMMQEGDKDLKGILSNIQHIKNNIGVPVVVKEVGCGISYEAATKLRSIGINVLDTGGYGGTNFVKIEAQRRNYKPIDKEILSWGIPTAMSIMELKKIPDLKIIACGGINSPSEAVKAFALGADYVSMAGYFLKVVTHYDTKSAIEHIEKFIEEVKLFMTLQGVKNIQEQKNTRVIIQQ